MFRKLLTTILIALTMVGMSTTVMASEEVKPYAAPSEVAGSNESFIVSNDPELLAQNQRIFDEVEVKAARAGLTLKNRVLTGQYFYGDQPFLVDSIEGPMKEGPVLTLEGSSKRGFSGECGVGAADIELSFGVDFEETITVTRRFQFHPIPARKVLTYRPFINQNVYEFDVYRGSTYLGTSKYWAPVGIVVQQEIK